VTAGAPARAVLIGLTGPIGCGKTTVAARLREHGAVVIDADRLARGATVPGSPALAAIVERFGAGVLAADGSLDRAALGRLVFDDPAELRALEAITHPVIRPLLLDAVDAAVAAGPSAVVIEAIRLVEGGYASLVDELWLIVCDGTAQRSRLAARGLAADEIERRIAAQSGLVERITPLASRVLDLSGGLEATLQAADSALSSALEAHARGSAARPSR